MQTWLIGLLLRPFIAFIVLACITKPIVHLIHHRMRDGRLKRLLLTRLT